MNAACLLAMGIVATIQCGSALAEPMGRLFLTPERRAVLDRERQMNISAQRTVEEPMLSVDGIVKRSSGKNTIWINGRSKYGQPGENGITAVLSPTDASRAIVGVTGEPVSQLKVGETLDRGSNGKIDLLGGGRVSSSNAR